MVRSYSTADHASAAVVKPHAHICLRHMCGGRRPVRHGAGWARVRPGQPGSQAANAVIAAQGPQAAQAAQANRLPPPQAGAPT